MKLLKLLFSWNVNSHGISQHHKVIFDGFHFCDYGAFGLSTESRVILI